jgi:hypothetical protein
MPASAAWRWIHDLPNSSFAKKANVIAVESYKGSLSFPVK